MDAEVSGNVSLVAGNIKIDPATHRVWIGTTEVPFSPTEFLILQKLCLHSGRVVPYREIFITVWGEFRPEMAEGLRVYIRHIRRKMQTAAETVSIVTRPGIGYMLSVGGGA
jgi:DNA-binding response OmpR family regulator